MKRIDKLTEETKREISRLYANKENTVIEIANKYNINKSEVAQIAIEMGGQPRRSKAFGKRKNGGKVKICPKCKKATDVKGARFCCYCGADIRSNIDILIERNEQLIKTLSQFPVNEREEIRDVILANIKALQGVQK